MVIKALILILFSASFALASWYDAHFFSIGGTSYGLLDIGTVSLVLLFGFWLSNKFKNFITHLGSHRVKLTSPSKVIIANFGRYLIIVITLLITFSTLGIDLTSLTVIAGALSVGIGFGLQNIINNFVSGIILMIEQSVRIGDIIEMGDKTRGKVREIRMRSTVVTTFDNIDIIIPNSELIQNRIINLTFTDNIRRLQIPFGVAYGTTFEAVDATIMAALSQSTLNLYEDDEKKSVLWMSALGDSSVNYQLNVWIRMDDVLSPNPTPSDVLRVIYQALQEAHIAIPFPQLDVTIKSAPTS